MRRPLPQDMETALTAAKMAEACGYRKTRTLLMPYVLLKINLEKIETLRKMKMMKFESCDKSKN
jgi:hypothetical protein